MQHIGVLNNIHTRFVSLIYSTRKQRSERGLVFGENLTNGVSADITSFSQPLSCCFMEEI